MNRMIPTLFCLWSGMLGGAAGGLMGMLGGPVVFVALAGLCVGFMCSVLIDLLLLALLFVTLPMTHLEFGDQPIGSFSSDTLSGLMGGITGLIAASVLALTTMPTSPSSDRTFVVCWSVSAGVPILLGLGVVAYSRRSV